MVLICVQEKRWEAWGIKPPKRRILSGHDYPTLLLGNFSGGIWDSELSIEFAYDRDYPLGYIQANPNLSEFMQLFFEGRDPFYELSQFFVRPKADILMAVQTSQKTMFRRHMIGIQLRRLKGPAEKLPEVKNYGVLADAILKQHGWNNNDTGIFVSTDSPSVLKELISAFPEKHFIFLDKNMSFGLQSSPNPGRIFDAYVDLFLLSACDEIILTFGSSFGWMAAGLGGVKPYMMLFGGLRYTDGDVVNYKEVICLLLLFKSNQQLNR